METNPVSPRQRYEGLCDKNMMRTGGKCMMGFKGCCCCCSFDSVVSDSVRPHRRQPTRLPRPWDSSGKNTGVGCHSLLQCMKVKSESEVTQSCPTLSDPMDCSPPGSSIHGILQARVLEWGAIAFGRDQMLKIPKGSRFSSIGASMSQVQIPPFF